MACSKKYRYRWNTKHAALELLYDSELYNLPGYYGGKFVNHFINNYFGFEGYNGIHLDLVMDNESFTYNFFEPMLFIESEWAINDRIIFNQSELHTTEEHLDRCFFTSEKLAKQALKIIKENEK